MALPARTETMRISVRAPTSECSEWPAPCGAGGAGTASGAKEISGAHRFDNFEDCVRPLKAWRSAM